MMDSGSRALESATKERVPTWANLEFLHTSRLSEDGNGAQESNTLKREREHQGRWPEPAFLGRISLESVDSKRLAGGQEQAEAVAEYWPLVSSSPAPQPAKSWSSEENGASDTLDSQSTGLRQSKRFRKYCSHNPYAAQAAAASLLAGAAWLEAVQKLQTLNSMMDPVGVKARNSS